MSGTNPYTPVSHGTGYMYPNTHILPPSTSMLAHVTSVTEAGNDCTATSKLVEHTTATLSSYLEKRMPRCAKGGRVGGTSAPLPKLILPKSTHSGKQMYPLCCTLGIHLSVLVLRVGSYLPGFKPQAVPLIHPCIRIYVYIHLH